MSFMKEAKREFFFRFVDPVQRAALRLDDEALYSTTDQVTADKITRDLLRVIPKTASVVDGTACIGGNTFSFAQHFAHVSAVELDPTRASHLRHNLRVLGVTGKVRVHQGDVRHVLPLIGQHDLVFLDPPWGGPEYKQHLSVPLYLSGVPLAEVCRGWKKYTGYIAIKAPSNFDLPTFLVDTQDFLELVHLNAQLRKMQLLILRIRTVTCPPLPVSVPSTPNLGTPTPTMPATPATHPVHALTTPPASPVAVTPPSPEPQPDGPPRSWKDVLLFGGGA